MSGKTVIVSGEIKYYCNMFTIERHKNDFNLGPIEIYQSRHFSFSV